LTRIPEFIILTGPMFGSKTTRMLALIDRYKHMKKSVVAFKPVMDDRYNMSMDDRYGMSKIVTHNGGTCDAFNVASGKEMIMVLATIDTSVDIVAVDEAFMIDGVADALIDIFRLGKTVIVSSIDLSSNCRPFPEMVKMFPWATSIQKCSAVCTVCNNDAYYTMKKTQGDDEISVGGSEMYEPRCWFHHDHTKDST